MNRHIITNIFLAVGLLDALIGSVAAGFWNIIEIAAQLDLQFFIMSFAQGAHQILSAFTWFAAAAIFEMLYRILVELKRQNSGNA